MSSKKVYTLEKPDCSHEVLFEQLLFVKGMMDLATEEDLRFAERVDYLSQDLFYMDVCGRISSRLNFHLNLYSNELMINILKEKVKWDVKRPYVIAKDFGIHLQHTLPFTTGVGPSYPSGHAALSRLYAHYLSAIFEDLRADLFNYSNRVCFSRLHVGVHFLRDIEAGKYLADCFFEDRKEEIYRKISVD